MKKNTTQKDFNNWIKINYNRLVLIIFFLIKYFENNLKITIIFHL